MSFTTIKEVKDAIVSQFVIDWASQTVIAYDNDDYKPPNDTTPWVRLNVQFSGGNQASLGSTGTRKFRYEGWVIVQVFTPIGSAKTSDNDGFANDAKNVFEGKHISGIWFREVGVRYVGPDGKWFQQNAMANFIYDFTK